MQHRNMQRAGSIQVLEEIGEEPVNGDFTGMRDAHCFHGTRFMFPATVLVAILTKFDVSVTLMASGIGTIIALLVSGRRIPMYYGSSFSYISVIITTIPTAVLLMPLLPTAPMAYVSCR